MQVCCSAESHMMQQLMRRLKEDLGCRFYSGGGRVFWVFFKFRYLKFKCVLIVLKDFSEETEINNTHVYSGFFYVELLSQTLTQTVRFSIFFPFCYFSSLSFLFLACVSPGIVFL